MGYNFLNHDGKLSVAKNCVHDSNIGYEADFSVNGEVNGWTYYNGIHTYGCWNNFLFGTLYDKTSVIGRYDVFRAVPAEDYYIVKIVMKFNFVERVGSQLYPSKGRISWQTLSNPVWGPDKEFDFDLSNDTEWHTYTLNMGEVQWWQGDVNNLRIYPILFDGKDGDEFFIRSIEILSINKYICLNYDCDYNSQFEHNCPGIGERGYCASKELDLLVSQGTTFEFSGDKLYTIKEGINDTLYVNINEYGFENIVLSSMENVGGGRIANELANEISKLDVGGYSECEVEYTDRGAFIIYAGNYNDDSTIRINDSQLARDLNFRDYYGNDISVKHIGRNPASGFRPLSSFRVKTHQVLNLLDEGSKSEFFFNPFIYSIEGGRRDWLDTGLGEPIRDIRGTEDDTLGLMNRSYTYIENNNKTIIDFSHPFNASGRITKVYAGVTLDNLIGTTNSRGARDSSRISTQLSGAKIMFFRPLKDGGIRVLPIEIELNDRNHASGKLYSATQEYVELDCDFFINKGDLIGVYNANVYQGRSISGVEIDALYYQIEGKASGDLKVRQPKGKGQSGLLLYARGDSQQNRLVLDIDLGKRVNVENIYIKGSSIEEQLEYNVARCLDIDWQVDLFGEDHTTGYIITYRPLVKAYYNHPNLFYGKNCLTDGIKTAPDGLAADGFQANYGTYYTSHASAIHKKNGGNGMVLSNPKYFSVNGDCEWLSVYYHVDRPGPFSVGDFNRDPIAFTIHFPYGKEKIMYKSKIFFKERFNFRSFGISHYRGEYFTDGNADDIKYSYIPNRTDGTDTPWVQVSLDGLSYRPEDPELWSNVDLYLANNPCVGHSVEAVTGVLEHQYDETMGYFDSLGGLQYYAVGEIKNNEQYIQATRLDWTILEHEWTPLKTKGFRFYCDYHESTKICEMELFCVVENVKSNMGGSVNVDYSDYGNYWWPAQNFTEGSGVRSFIGNTPQYARITISPITEIKLSGIILDVSYTDVFMGKKGCQYTFLPLDVKRGSISEPQKIDFKNTYGRSYDLYVDIDSNEAADQGVIFYSLLNNKESITNPMIGPDAYYRKHEDYKIANYNKNVAINCPVYALKNLVEGADAWYSHDKEYSWQYLGKISEDSNLNFSNLPNTSITTLNIPVLNRSKWWKIGFFDPRVITKVREIQIWFGDEEIFGVKFYHNKNQNPITSGNTDTAPHLQNRIVDGSYYILTDNNYIGFELPEVQPIDRIIIFHDTLPDYENSADKAGIDISTALCIHGEGDHLQSNSIVDESYYEHSIQVVGSGIYCDEQFTEINYSFTQDFSNCQNYIETFTGPDINLTTWTDLVNASIVSDKLHVTNSGIIGEVTTVTSYSGDFDLSVDLNLIAPEDNPGWGGYIEAFAGNNYVRVGRTFNTSIGHCVNSIHKTNSGVSTIGSASTSQTTNLKLRLKRDGISTTAYAFLNSSWVSLATSSSAISSNDVKFRLISDLSPLAQGITTAVFDNFTIDKSDADWGVNTDYSSTFTCTSGLPTSVPNGWGYYYNVGTADYSAAAGYKIPRINEYQLDPLDQDYEFTFKFQFQAESFLNDQGVSDNNYGISIGLLSHKVQWYTLYYRWMHYFTGVQVVLRRDNIGIALQNTYCDNYLAPVPSSFVSLNTRAMPYYCTFKGNGAGTYTLKVWTDTWEGMNQVASVTLNSTLPWEADKVGVGSSYHNIYGVATGRCRGWVSAFDFTCYKKSLHQKIGTSIKFNAFPNEHLLVSYVNNPNCNIVKEGFNFDTKRYTIDFHVMFESLPSNNGDTAWFMGSWHPDQPMSGAIASNTPSSWVFYIERVSGGYRWRFRINSGGQVVSLLDWSFFPDLYRWYHIMLCRGVSSSTNNCWVLLKDGHNVAAGDNWTQTVIRSSADVIIGKSFKGWMDEIRISSDYTLGGGRVSSWTSEYHNLNKTVPVRRYERYYTFSLYDSYDNVYYGKNMDVDVLFDNSYSYHEPFSVWSEKYYSFLAIDFGQRHSIDIVRSFPINTSYQFTKTSNILYSNKDTADPQAAFFLSEGEQELSTGFDGQNYDFPYNFIKQDTTKSTSYIIDDTFYQMTNPTSGEEYALAVFKPYLKGNFDVQIDFDLGPTPPLSTNLWQLRLQVMDINNSNKKARIERAFQNSIDQYAFWVRDNNSSWTKKSTNFISHQRGTLRLTRNGQIFQSFFKEKEATEFVTLGYHQMLNNFGNEVTLSLYTLSSASSYPKIENWWDNFLVNLAEPVYSNYTDTRWARIKMLSGDGVNRTIKRVGIYPDITIQSNQAGQYNCEWLPLGSAVTSYAADDNIALGCVVSGSSYVGEMEFEHITDGIIPVGDFDKCWGSDNNSSQWVTIHLPELSQIYRIIIYHGYAESDSKNLVVDYQVQISTNNETYTTIFNITGNTSFKRTHDLSSPVWATQVRINITNYNAINRYIWTGEEDGFQFWKGAILREVEVYKYYGFTVVNSEETPVIAVDLKQNYFIEGHSVIGIDTEAVYDINWSNSDSNFTYANSNLDDPKKLSFRPWGSLPGYDKWVAIKRNTANNYPTVVTSQYPQTDMPDYLKHVVIKGATDEIGTKPNPFEYPWMWRSSVSTLSYDYDKIHPEGYALSRSLKIEYPATTEGEHVYFIEGDTFGIDSVASWRDGFGFHLYIDNIENLDTDYGYIYFGGFDYTRDSNPVVHRWYWSTISGALQNGWNNLNLTFMYADEVLYTELSDKSGRDPRRFQTINWGRIGMVFRGNGNPITMNWDGSFIERNHFEHGCFKGYGLYLHANDLLKIQVGEMTFHSGTIEFFVRPDWNWEGKDIYGEFKYRSIFHLGNVANDMLGASMGPRGLEVYYGNLLDDLNIFGVTGLNTKLIDTTTHMAFVFSNDGKGIDSDKSTIRIYINNVLVAKEYRTWKVSDDKHFNFIFGGQGVLAQKARGADPASSAVDGVLSRLRIHNYCKTDFSDSLNDSEFLEQKDLNKPSQFIELSKDNVTFHKIGSDELPFFFKDVPNGNVIPVWVRLDLPKSLAGSERRTAKIIGNWDIGV